ncbi:TetR/AcrR family transcriptional regulator [Mycobacterium sp. E3305]|uniref:TetR/AcrR family transcriptional regulator n=1 Tax=Mycobacterium sp. E3305 TaxID=1834145 RepID=UPI000A55E0F8|nr:TetR/AcrR family transcriptional regulator [Mycobacterium sp. E3305]
MVSQPRRGRPRSAAAHEAILAATRSLLVDVGYAGISMDKVAAAAGVGMQTVYRRWPSKAPLVAEAVMQQYPPADFALPDTGDCVDDLRTWMREYAARTAASENAALIRALAAAAAENLDDRDSLYRQLTGRIHHAVQDRLRKGISQGQIQAGADVEAVADALIGAILYRILSATTPVSETLDRYDGLIDTLTRGLGPH